MPSASHRLPRCRDHRDPRPRRGVAAARRDHDAGRLQAAEQGYRRVPAPRPGHADALHLLGVLALQVGRPREATR